MGNIIKKMRNQAPYCFRWFNIFLAANMTEAAAYFCITIQTIFFCSFFKVRQWVNFN